MSKRTIAELAEAYGASIGDVIDPDTGFVLLVFRGDDGPNKGGITFSTNTEAPAVREIVAAFLAQVDAATEVAKASG